VAENRSKVKENFIFNALYQISRIIVPVVTLPYLTRTLHAQGLGEYSFAYSVAYYFYIFIRLGLQNYGNRTIAYCRDDRKVLSRTFFEIYAFQAFLGIVVSLIYLVYCFVLAPNRSLALIFLLMVLSEIIDVTWAMYGLEEFKVTSSRDIAVKILTALAIFLFVKDAGDVGKYSLIYCVGFFLSQIVTIPFFVRQIEFVKPDLSGIRKHIKPNMILFLPTVAVSIYKTMDKIMLGAMANDVELGYYHSSENIIAVPLALITALGTVMLPRMSNMISRNSDSSEIEDAFNKSIAFAMFISTSICIGIMTVSKEFVPLFFGPGFEKCITLFYIILPSCIFLAFANVIRTQYLLPRKMDKLFIISLFSGAGVNLILNLILIPVFESVGAAIGTLVAEIAVCVIQAACVFKEAKIGRNIINSIPFLVAGVAMFLLFRNFMIGIPNQIVALGIKILICGIFYMLVLGMFWVAKKLVVKYSGKKR
jgi:O-antigen/teichoic acid export membrane protein